MTSFEQHGDFKVWRHHNIVYARLSGSWNKEAAIAFSTTFKKVAEPLVNAPWAHIVYLDDWDLCAPEMLPVVQDLVSWCIENNLHRAAQIYSPSMIKAQLLNKMVVEQLGAFTRATFAEEVQAINWLAEQGFPVD